MQYGLILRSSLGILKRHKYFIFLAWLAGEFGGFSFGFGNVGPRSSPNATGSGNQIGQWLGANLGLILSLALIALALAIVFFVLGRVATGALYSAQAQAASTRVRVSFSEGWAMGRKSFRRLILFDLFWVGLVLAIGFLFAVVLLVAPLLLFVLIPLLLIAAIPVAIVLPIPLAWARRSIVLDSQHGKAAFFYGWKLFVDDLGTNILFGLMMVGIGIALTIGTVAILLVVGLPLILMFFSNIGSNSANWTGVAVYGAVLVVFIFVLSSAVGAFKSTCWTLGYQGLRAKAQAPKPAPAPMLSADWSLYWDGVGWRPVPPPGAPISPDGYQWWNGYNWLPLPPRQ